MEKKSARQAAIEVLQKEGGPLATKELAQRTLATKGVELKGKTPVATIAAMLATSNKKGGPFVRFSPGVYGLRDEVAEPEREKGDEGEQEGESTEEEPTEQPDEHSASLREAAAAADRKAKAKRQAKPHPKPSAKSTKREKATA